MYMLMASSPRPSPVGEAIRKEGEMSRGSMSDFQWVGEEIETIENEPPYLYILKSL
jgi:hypothetical protein